MPTYTITIFRTGGFGESVEPGFVSSRNAVPVLFLITGTPFRSFSAYSVGFVAAAVSMPMGGCRARRPVGGRPLVSAETVGVIVASRPAAL